MVLEIAEAMDPFGVDGLLDTEVLHLASSPESGLAKDREETDWVPTAKPVFPRSAATPTALYELTCDQF